MFNIHSFEQYRSEYHASLNNPETFWHHIANHFHWFKPIERVSDCNLEEAHIEWFRGAYTNISYNCLDRHISDKPAIIFEPNNPNEASYTLSYRELHQKVCQFANMLTAQGIQPKDRVCIYMPMIPEAAIAMLACARIGAIHCVVFAGFSAKSLASRIQDAQAKMLITSDLLFRGEKTIDLLGIAQEALQECTSIEHVIVYKRGDTDCGKALIWQDIIKQYSTTHACVEVEANHPLFILYTSGSTGKPKGIFHAHGGYMVYAGYTFQNVFQYKPNNVFFCSADIGWITGHSYVIYGAFLSGATTVMYEGVPTYPTPSRFWQIIEKHRVHIFYTAPTAIRALMQKGDAYVNDYALDSLHTLGSVGEPINAEAWEWYHHKVGKQRCPIVDTWWQTETGGVLISALSGITPSVATYAGLPLCGIAPVLLNEHGEEITEPHTTGYLCIKQPWPGMLQGVWGDAQKFRDTYFSTFKGYYVAGDGAFKNEDGLFRIIGRMDDVMNVSGHRLGSAEIENTINMHEHVVESAVIGFPHAVKGEGICAFVVTREQQSEHLEHEITALIVQEIGAIAKPDKLYVLDDLPKTRSGKIMRRILKKIVLGETDFGDTSTLLNPDFMRQFESSQR